jgi:hypothetical protein
VESILLNSFNILIKIETRKNMGSEVGDFIVGWAAFKTVSSKMIKYDKTCSDNQHVLILFAFDIFGFLVLEVVNPLKRVQKVMHI